MTIRTHYLAAAAALAAVAAPAAAQTAYPGYAYQQYPQYQQQYPQQAYPYGQQGYGYQQTYSQNPVGQIIDSLLGNRYNVTDRQAVSQCASAAMAQASAQYRGGYGGGYNNAYANNGYNRGYSHLRVTSITDVQRRNNGLRVTGTLGSGYGNQHGYQNQGGYGGDLSFRCNVAYNGAVTNIRINRGNRYRG